MVRRLGLCLAVMGAASGFAGCTCNSASEYNFPTTGNPDGDGVVDPPISIGSWLSFDASPDGARLTMSYYDKDKTAVAWAQGIPAADGTVTWSHERVQGYPDSNGLDLADVGKYSSQKTAPDGTVWLAYQNLKTGGLNVAHRLGPDRWEVTEPVDGGTLTPGTIGGVGHWASLALDAEGKPVVAHCDLSSAAVRISRFDGESWSTTQAYRSLPVDETDAEGVVTTRPGGVGYTDLIIDGSDEYVAFYDSAQGALHVMHGTGGSSGTLTDELVDDEGDVGAWPSLVVSKEELWVAYQDVGQQHLMFATWSQASGWTHETVDTGEMHGADTAVFDRDGSAAIVYQDALNNDQWLATRAQNGEWNLEKLIGDEGPVGFHNEVAFAAGKWWSGSFDYAKGALALKQL